MGGHLEIELKWALDPTGHGILRHELPGVLGEPHLLLQDNRFFDTADHRLRRAALNLRLRRENQSLVMTCKGRAGIGPAGEHRHTEWEERLDPLLWPEIAAGRIDAGRLPLPGPVRDTLGDATLMALGGFTNERLEFHHTDGPPALLCLDRTDFLGRRTDHELEIETAAPEHHAALWQERLRSWNVAFTPQAHTKFARFLALTGP
jgi:uncharacterized protein YjbK